MSSQEHSAFLRFYTSIVKSVSFKLSPRQEAIIKCNPKYKDQWSFDALSSFVKVSVRVLTLIYSIVTLIHDQ